MNPRGTGGLLGSLYSGLCTVAELRLSVLMTGIAASRPVPGKPLARPLGDSRMLVVQSR